MFFHRFFVGLFCLILILCAIFFSNVPTLSPMLQTLNNENTYPTIVIDAGHGGMDSGTSGNDGTLEKQLNLEFSEKFNVVFTLMGHNTKLTRTEDVSLGEGKGSTIRETKRADLEKRLQMVEETEKAILFSVHQNNFKESQYSGFQTFYNHNNSLNPILAQWLQKDVAFYLQPDNSRKAKTIGSEIYLLHHCTKTAVMIECGFMSNPAELQQLKNDEYQIKMAFVTAKTLTEIINIHF